MSECRGAREQSEHCGASERVSGASKRTNGRANGPVLTSGFLAVLDHSLVGRGDKKREVRRAVVSLPLYDPYEI